MSDMAQVFKCSWFRGFGSLKISEFSSCGCQRFTCSRAQKNQVFMSSKVQLFK